MNHELTSQPAEGGVGLVEGLDLLDRRPPAEAGKTADELDVGKVAGGQRVRFAAAEETEALDRPGADLAHRPQASVVSCQGGVAAAAGDLTGNRAQGDRAPQRQVHRLQLGRRPAGDRRRAGNVPQCASPGPQPRAPTTDDAALDQRRSLRLDQLLDDRPGERLPGPGRTPRPPVRTAAQDRPKQRVAAKASVELGEVVVDGEREAHALDRDLELRGAGRPRGRDRARGRAGERHRVDRLGPQSYPLRAGLPGPDEHRAVLDMKQTGDDPAGDPDRAVLAAVARQAVGKRGCDLCLEPPQRPSR